MRQPTPILPFRHLDELRKDASRWNIGILLFGQGRSDMTRFYGLSLVRDFLSSEHAASDAGPAVRLQIRETVWAWLSALMASSQQLQSTPAFLLNNLASVLTLCIKRDYPEHWPGAFDDLLLLAQGSSSSSSGAELLVRVLGELEIEVVMFSEARSRQEVAHNTLIKDRMRETDALSKVVGYLVAVVNSTLGGVGTG
ncbi:hypothetical protein EON64_19835, partial [archaeon]